MRSTTFAIAAMSLAALTSGRVISKARATSPTTVPAVQGGAENAAAPKQAFELDVTTAQRGLQDYYSREDGYIYIRLTQGDTLEHAVVRSSKSDVTCTIEDSNGYQIRKFGAEFSDTYERQEWETEHASAIGCFFAGESKETYSDMISGETKHEPRAEGSPSRQAFEMDITTELAGVTDYYSREDGFIRADIAAGDNVISAVVRSVQNNVVCTIKDSEGYQVRKFGGEHPQSIELSEYEGMKAATVGCFFEDEVAAN